MKKLRVPYHKQEKNYTCGIACFRMVLSFFGEEVSRLALARRSGIRMPSIAKKGITTRTMKRIAKVSKLSYFEKERARFEDIIFFLNQNIPVIVNYIEPSHDDGHYAVVIGLDSKRIILNDPWNGKNFTLARTFFENRWRGANEKKTRWMLAVWGKE